MINRLLTFLALALALACFWTPARAGEPAPLPVGVIYNMNGFDALIAKEGRRGVELAFNLVNAKGGINGRKIKAVFRDLGGALALDDTMNQLIEKEKVLALVGLNDSDTALVAGPAAQAGGVPLVAAGCTMNGLASQIGSAFFTSAFDNTAQARAMAEFAVKSLGFAKTVILHCPATDSEGDLYKELLEAVPKAGGKVVFHAELDSEAQDLDVVMKELQDYSKVMEVLFIIAPPDPLARTLSTLNATGFGQAVVCSVGADFPGVENDVGRFANQVFTLSMADLTGDLPETRLFAQRYQEAYHEPPPSGFAAIGFDAAALLVNAISRTHNPDRSGIIKSLAAIRSFKGVTGNFVYPPGSRTPKKNVYVLNLQGGSKTLASAFAPE